MPTTRRPPKNLSAAGCLWSIVLIALIVFSLIWNGQQPAMTSDAEMIEQWQRSKSQWLEVIGQCDRTQNTYDLAEQYDQTDPLIALGSLDNFTGCEVQTVAPERSDDFQVVAQSNNAFLLVTDQRRKGTGWIEEKASLWSGGWVSWKSAILEEKGFIYTSQDTTSQDALEDTISPLPIAAEITTEPLDQFVGQYRGTSQISGNSSCELWKLRPIGSEPIKSEVDGTYKQSTWYLFYHQARECPS